MENTTTSNETLETTENVVVQDVSTNEQLAQIHEDLGVIISFIVFFVLVIILKYAYKFFDMIFKF